MSPRTCLLVVLLATGCRAGGPQPSVQGPLERAPFTVCCPQLTVRVVSSMSDRVQGGLAVVYLHGYGQPVERLLLSALELARRAPMRVFLPEGPIRHRQGGPGWWHFDVDWSGNIETGDEQPPPLEIPPLLTSARVGVQKLVDEVRARHRPQALVLAGFSQGAMLAVDVAAVGAPVDRVLVMGGALLAASLPAMRARHDHRPPMLIVHGRQDYFRAAELMEAILRRHGWSVTMRSFDGGHVLPSGGTFDEVASFVMGR